MLAAGTPEEQQAAKAVFVHELTQLGIAGMQTTDEPGVPAKAASPGVQDVRIVEMPSGTRRRASATSRARSSRSSMRPR